MAPWQNVGYRSYENGPDLRISYFSNIGEWRLDDNRGASPEAPKPLDKVMSFHRTLTDAKRAAAAATWHTEAAK